MAMTGRRTGLLPLYSGASVAYQRWGQEGVSKGRRVLALHGWLDNSNSFAHLGPYLGSRGFDFVALDIPGHGLSSRLSPGTHFFPYCVEMLRAVMEQLRWDGEKSTLIGHSMGGAIAMVFNGCFPELVHKAVLIDQVGPLMHPSQFCADKLRTAIDARRAFELKGRKVKQYSSIEDTINARLRALTTYPGTQTLSREAALILMQRGVVTADKPDDAEDTGGEIHSEFRRNMQGPVIFRHDPQLLLPSYTYMSPEQVSFTDIEVRGLFLIALGFIIR